MQIENNKPFLDYYNEHGIIPTRQDLTDINGLVSRRSFLYAQLGVPLSYLRGKTILELGPGGGYNAIATSSHNPALYVFVDAGLESLRMLEENVERGLISASSIEIIERNIFEFSDERKFDLVIIEATIPGQDQPNEMLRDAASFVAPGGLLITTCSSPASVLSELCRRLFRIRVMQDLPEFEEQVELLSEIFAPHLRSLESQTRTPQDWVMGVLLHDWHTGKYVFGVEDTVSALSKEFDFFHSQPRLLLDGRFYKSVSTGDGSTNDLLIEQAKNWNLSTIDYRISPVASISESFDSVGMQESLEILMALHDTMVTENSYRLLDSFLVELEGLMLTLPKGFELTKIAASDFIKNFPTFAEGRGAPRFEEFQKWWGRGQQYVSLMRTH